MAKAPEPAPVDTNTQGDPTPLMDSLDKTGGPQFVIDQMADTLERARIDAQGRTDDMTIRWGHEPDAPEELTEDAPGDNVYARRFFVIRDDAEPQHGLTVDEAKAALDAFVADA